MNVTLKPPPELQDEPSKGLSLGLTESPINPDKLAEIEKQVKAILEDFKQNTQGLQRRLQVLNDMLEGVTQEVNYPFPNASNTDTKMAIGTARTLRSTMIRALFADPDRTFVASIDDEAKREDANRVEEAFNWKAAHENGLVDALKDSIIPIFRDGTAFLQGVWEKRVEKVLDYRTYVTFEDFQADYPDAESAGIDPEKYEQILRHLAEPDAYLDVCFQRNLTKKDGAVFSIVTLARFAWWPLSAPSLDDCELYGVRMRESEAEMKRKKKTKEYKADPVDSCFASAKDRTLDSWDRSRDFIEGISSQSDSTKRKEFENYRLVLTIDLDGDDVPEKYMGVFNFDCGKFLNFDRYKIRNNIDFLVPLRFCRRDDRLLGPSLLYDGMDLFQEINDIHRHRNNTRMITDSPGFKAEKELKDEIEGDLQNWRPGVVVWVPQGKMNAVQQFNVTNPSNTQNSMDEENMLSRAVEFVIGPTQGMSGQETKGDASAPATKHLSKIRQAGFRIDDYIDEIKRSFPSVGKLAMALYYQYGAKDVAYQTKDENGQMISQKADRALFGAEGLTMDLNARSVIMSPEFEMEKIMALRQEAGQNPSVAQLKPTIFGLLWDRFLAAARVQNPEELKLGELAQTPPIMPSPGAPPMPGMPGAGKTKGVGNGQPPLKSLLSSMMPTAERRG